MTEESRPQLDRHSEDSLQPPPVVTTDNKGDVTFLNPVAESLTGWTQEEAAGKSLDAVFSKPTEGLP
jgi:PAS domain S-box-containing protein